jgi:hypothetical protein
MGYKEIKLIGVFWIVGYCKHALAWEVAFTAYVIKAGIGLQDDVVVGQRVN